MTSNKRGNLDNPNYRPSWKRKLSEGYADTIRPYGDTDGQLGAMPAGGFEAAVSSPPYSETRFDGGLGAREKGYGNFAPYSGERADTWRTQRDQNNLGNQNGPDFWTAARQIVDQVCAVLVPGGHCIWVLKDYIKNKERVPFCDQWRQMCEAAGLVTVHIHRAWLVEDRGTQFDLNGDGHKKVVERKSFFRRLAEKKGSPRIDYEVVLCMEKRGKSLEDLPMFQVNYE